MFPVGYVVHVRTPGMSGGETRSYQVAQALGAAGLSVHIYGEIDSTFSWHQNVQAHRLRHPLPSGLFQLLSEFSRYKISVAVERYQFPLFNVASLAQRVRRQPVILEVHGFPIDEYALLSRRTGVTVDPLTKLLGRLPRALWEKAQACIFRETAHFIVTSKGTKEILTSMGVPMERVTVVYNCVDPVLFDPAGLDPLACRKALGLPTDGWLVLYAGSLFHEELAKVIAAVPGVLQKWSTARFCFAGSGPAEKLRMTARMYGLSEQQLRVIPSIPHQQMPVLLAAADVVLAPYSLESERFHRAFHYSPLKVLEALAMEKVVVTVQADELRTTFGNVNNVQFVASSDQDGWCDAIIRSLELSTSPRLAEGRSFVIHGYRWQDAAQKYQEILQMVESTLV